MTFNEAFSKIFSDGIFLSSLIGFVGYELSRGYEVYWKPYLEMNHVRSIAFALLVYAVLISSICSLIVVSTGATWFHALLFGFTFPSSAKDMQQKLGRMGAGPMSNAGSSVPQVPADDIRIGRMPISRQLAKALSQAIGLPPG